MSNQRSQTPVEVFLRGPKTPYWLANTVLALFALIILAAIWLGLTG